jgi:hypothetical protein
VNGFLEKNSDFTIQKMHTLYPHEKHDGAFACLMIKKRKV